jgi:hypothetical protein
MFSRMRIRAGHSGFGQPITDSLPDGGMDMGNPTRVRVGDVVLDGKIGAAPRQFSPPDESYGRVPG